MHEKTLNVTIIGQNQGLMSAPGLGLVSPETDRWGVLISSDSPSGQRELIANIGHLKYAESVSVIKT